MNPLTKKLIKSDLKKRSPNSHKGDHGHALLIAGQEGKMGATVLAARACLRSGAGLLTIHVPRSERVILQIAIPEAMLTLREDGSPWDPKYSAMGIGPGLGTDKISQSILLEVLKNANIPSVLDADALNLISKNKKLLNHLPEQTILTPHPLEFDRLFGKHTTPSNRIDTATQKAKEYNIIIVLKSHQTIITDGFHSFVNKQSHAGLAKGGSGDALTGLITGLLAQGYSPIEAARIGVYVHIMAAKEASKKQSDESMLISDVIECFGRAFKSLWR
jgi:hydroxyethylthiazole kinase-like uncharacterized protein yjeF